MIRTLALLAALAPLAGAAAQPAAGQMQVCLRNEAPVSARFTVTSTGPAGTVHHTPDIVLLGQTRCTAVVQGRQVNALVESMDASLRYGQACQRAIPALGVPLTITLQGNAVSGVHCS